MSRLPPPYASDHRDERRRCKTKPRDRTECERPAHNTDEHAEIARMPYPSIDAAGHPTVTRLDPGESAETVAEDEHRPQPEHAACPVKRNAKPANGIAVDRAPAQAARVGWEPADEEADRPKDAQYPSVRAVLAHARAQVSRARMDATVSRAATTVSAVNRTWEKNGRSERDEGARAEKCR